MITLSNGHQFWYMAASGALAFTGKGWFWERPLRWIGLFQPSLFTVVMKTVTLKPRRGNLRWNNPFGCIRILRGGTVNAVGLTNKGIEWWCRRIGPSIGSARISVVGSILGEPDELAEMAGMLNNFKLVAIEINASCPNTDDDILRNTAKVIESCQRVKSATAIPLILKLSVVHDVETIIRELEGANGLVEALSINSVPWSVVFPGRKSPLAHLGGGGVSGKIAQPFTWGLVKKLVELTTIPVIGPGVWDFPDIEKLRGMGARVVSFGSVFLPHPCRPTLFARWDKKRMEDS